MKRKADEDIAGQVSSSAPAPGAPAQIFGPQTAPSTSTVQRAPVRRLQLGPIPDPEADGAVQGSGAHPVEAGGIQPVQRKASGDAPDAASPAQIAGHGVAGGGGQLPHLDQIQASFGRHDVSGVTAHQGPATTEAAHALGARAYAVGNAVGFDGTPDLHTAAHEAAHVVQQRGGVQLKGGIDGGAGDPYERHADQVADAVVAGQSAESLLDQMPGGSVAGGVVQRAPQPAASVPAPEPSPARGTYVVELTPEGNYVFVFNTTDMRGWTEPVFTALRYYMQQVFPGVGDAVIRKVLTELHVHFDRNEPVPAVDDHAYELSVTPTLHRNVVGWMKSHHPELAPQTPRTGGDGLRQADLGGGGKATGAKRPGMTATSADGGAAAPADKTSAEVEHTRALYEKLRKAFPDATELRGNAAWPEFLAFVADHADELKPLLHGGGKAAADLDELRKLLAQFQQHQQAKDGDTGGDVGGHADGKLGGDKAGTKDGDAREQRPDGIKGGSIYGEAGGDKYGWIRWVPQGQVQVTPKQPTYVAGSSVRVELAWDLSVHPDAGLVLLPNHCSYQWTVRRGGKAVDSAGHSIFADDRHASLDLGDQPGAYEIEVTASSNHFKTERHRFSSSVVINAIDEKAFDQSTFDAANVASPDAAFSRDDQGHLHVKAGEKAQTTQQEISSLDLTKGGIDALANQGKLTGDNHSLLVGQIDKQRAALVKIQDKTKDGTPYVVRGTFVSREDSTALPLRLLMHMVKRTESGDVAFYELILHDTTLGEPVRHPGSAIAPLDGRPPAIVYPQLEDDALDIMAGHFHAQNDYPRGTVHLAAQKLTSDSVWEKTLDTNNGRKKTQRVLGTIAAIGGVALMVVPGGGVVSAGLMVITSAAGIASVAMDIEHRVAQEGWPPKLDRRLAMDVLQVVAVALPFGTLTKTFAAARPLGKAGALLCMTSLDIAQGFLISAEVKAQLALIDANTEAQLATATSDEQRKQIYAERDRQVAEIIGGAVVNGGFLLVSLGHGIKNTIATTRAGARFSVREPIRELVNQGRERMQETLASDTFEHENGRVQLTAEERRYLEHEIATPEATRGREANHRDANESSRQHTRETTSADSSGPADHKPADPGTKDGLVDTLADKKALAEHHAHADGSVPVASVLAETPDTSAATREAQIDDIAKILQEVGKEQSLFIDDLRSGKVEASGTTITPKDKALIVNASEAIEIERGLLNQISSAKLLINERVKAGASEAEILVLRRAINQLLYEYSQHLVMRKPDYARYASSVETGNEFFRRYKMITGHALTPREIADTRASAGELAMQELRVGMAGQDIASVKTLAKDFNQANDAAANAGDATDVSLIVNSTKKKSGDPKHAEAMADFVDEWAKDSDLHKAVSGLDNAGVESAQLPPTLLWKMSARRAFSNAKTIQVELRTTITQTTRDGFLQSLTRVVGGDTSTAKQLLEHFESADFDAALAQVNARAAGDKIATNDHGALSQSFGGLTMEEVAASTRKMSDAMRAYRAETGEARAMPTTLGYTIHAGEQLRSVDPFTLLDQCDQAVSLGADRIGHGLILAVDPELLVKMGRLKPAELPAFKARQRQVSDRVKAAGITVEVNITSNTEISNLTNAEHPAGDMVNTGMKVSISTDDETVLHTTVATELKRLADAKGVTRTDVATVILEGFHSRMGGRELRDRARLKTDFAAALRSGLSPSEVDALARTLAARFHVSVTEGDPGATILRVLDAVFGVGG